jgi:hypothetical protein
VTPIQQTKFGEEGNCFAAVLASLFTVPIEDVEHIVGDVGEGWLDRLGAWLTGRGCAFAFVPAAFYRLPDALYIACGFTARGHYHAVIRRGDTLVHDPHPDGAGLDETTELLFIMPQIEVTS